MKILGTEVETNNINEDNKWIRKITTILKETKHAACSKNLEAKRPSCVTAEIYPYANILKSTKRSSREI